MHACTVKGIKLFTTNEIENSTRNTKKYRQFHNKHAKVLCKSNFSLKNL